MGVVVGWLDQSVERNMQSMVGMQQSSVVDRAHRGVLRRSEQCGWDNKVGQTWKALPASRESGYYSGGKWKVPFRKKCYNQKYALNEANLCTFRENIREL